MRGLPSSVYVPRSKTLRSFSLSFRVLDGMAEGNFMSNINRLRVLILFIYYCSELDSNIELVASLLGETKLGLPLCPNS